MDIKKIIIKLIIAIVIAIVLVLFLGGCNRQTFDFDYTFNYAILNIDGEYKEMKISSWRDYADGDQLQIKDMEGNTYLVHSVNCTLINK